MRLLEMFEDSQVEIGDVADVIGADPALTSKIIAYCNSPLLGRQTKTASLHQAIVTLGLRTVKMIGLSFTLVNTFSAAKNKFAYQAFWNQSLAVAIASRSLSQIQSQDADEAFVSGLMLKIGILAIGHHFPEEYSQVLIDSGLPTIFLQNQKLTELERQKWSTDHYQMGAGLVKHWNFPTEFCEVLEKFANEIGSSQEKHNTMSLAEPLASLLFSEHYTFEDLESIKRSVLGRLDLEEDQFDDLIDEVVTQWIEYAKLFDFDETLGIKSMQDLEQRARRNISQVALGLQEELDLAKEKNDLLESQVFLDNLTGLKNRRAYESEVEVEMQRSIRSGNPFSLMIVDIDQFKSVNDTYGHAGGDKVLEAIAACLKRGLRPYDSVYRLGGEEFVLVLSDCDLQSGIRIAERTRALIENRSVPYLEQEIKVTVSIGGACVAPTNLCSLSELFNLADSMLYAAKNEGRNCCRVTRVGAFPLKLTSHFTELHVDDPQLN